MARHVHEWGIEITNILIKDIVVNKELQDALSSAAKERRLAGKFYTRFRIQDFDCQG